jgi:3-hydroxybutyryl-CoA dehydratase
MITIGQTYLLKKTISQNDVELYANSTGDYNPIHFNKEYAEKTRFKRNIVHGMYLLGLVSNVIGNHLPGNGTIYSTQTVRFHKPVYIGDTVFVRVNVLDIIQDKSKFILETTCFLENDVVVLSGEAVVYNYEINFL